MEGECHFNKGNFRARKRVEQAQKILDAVGIGGERVQMYNLSSSEGPRFAEIAIEMDEKISKMGPNPIKKTQKDKAA
jgi:coenzyme F420-reducing hydrogenase delta subunit